MSISVQYKKEINNLIKELPKEKIEELIDFRDFSYRQVKDSAMYVRKLRIAEGKRFKTSNKFIKELIEWQKSDS